MEEKKASNGVDFWFHLDCFINNKTEFGFNFKSEEY